MSRTRLITISSAAFVAILSLSTLDTRAGGISDQDGDGVPDEFDNCLFLANGPLASTNSCGAQEDADMDGYGNPCDFDINQDGATGLDDIVATYAAAYEVSTDPIIDHNCDGAVGLDDVHLIYYAASQVMTPGPSGLACAGTVPCVAP